MSGTCYLIYFNNQIFLYCAHTGSDEFFSVRVDVRKFIQFLTSEQVNPSKVVCNIVDDHMVVLFVLHEDVTLHYFLPVISL